MDVTPTIVESKSPSRETVGGVGQASQVGTQEVEPNSTVTVTVGQTCL